MEFKITRASMWSTPLSKESSLYSKLKEHIDKESWTIEINSIDELLTLIREEGELIINEDSIIIYDSYIE